ncbi:MAG: hypothetical protein ACI9OJ_000594, partial [Myxococcota bacterium]
REISRLIVDGGLPTSTAIWLTVFSAQRPLEMSSRSESDRDRGLRRRTGGLKPPVDNTTRFTLVAARSSARPISHRD